MQLLGLGALYFVTVENLKMHSRPSRAHGGNTNVSLATDVQALPFKGQHLLGALQTVHYAGHEQSLASWDIQFRLYNFILHLTYYIL